MYEAIRRELPDLMPKNDIVFIVVTPELLTTTPEELARALTGCLRQSHLYKTTEN